MSFLRAIYLAAAAGISGYLHESIFDRWLTSNIHSRKQNNKTGNHSQRPSLNGLSYDSTAHKWWQSNFKVNAQVRDPCNVFDDSFGEEEETDVETEEDPNDDPPEEKPTGEDSGGGEPEIPGAKKLKVGCEIQVYADPIICSRNIIIFQNDWAVHCDSRTRTPFWTIENIMQCNVHQVEHRHCEAFRVSFTTAVGFKYGHPDNNKRLDVNHVYIPALRPAPAEESGEEDKETCRQEFICDYCQYSKFWGVFHQYIRFLTCMYDYVQVCSGLLYLTQEESENEEFNGLSEEQLTPTHFFKALLCRNADGSYRFECYKIPNEPMNDEEHECIDLQKYLVTRDDLETDAGFCIFPHVARYSMRQANTHPQFIPTM